MNEDPFDIPMMPSYQGQISKEEEKANNQILENIKIFDFEEPSLLHDNPSTAVTVSKTPSLTKEKLRIGSYSHGKEDEMLMRAPKP